MPTSPNERDVTSTELPPSGGQLAHFASTPATSFDEVYVVVPGFDGGVHLHGPCKWSPQITSAGQLVMPKKEYPCIVVVDDFEDLWISRWWAPDDAGLPIIPAPIWHDVDPSKFVGPWANRGAPEEILGYRTDVLGNVLLRGQINGQATNVAPQNICVPGTFPIPVNGKQKRYIVACSGPIGPRVSVSILPDGALEMTDYSGSITAWIDLSGVGPYTTN